MLAANTLPPLEDEDLLVQAERNFRPGIRANSDGTPTVSGALRSNSSLPSPGFGRVPTFGCFWQPAGSTRQQFDDRFPDLLDRRGGIVVNIGTQQRLDIFKECGIGLLIVEVLLKLGTRGRVPFLASYTR